MLSVMPPPPPGVSGLPMPPTARTDGRDDRGRWLPGHWPGFKSPGRPVVAAEVKKLTRCHGADAVAELVRIMHYGESDSDRRAAANDLLNRGYGKAAQIVEIGGPGSFEQMDDQELREYVRKQAIKLIEGEVINADTK